MEKLFIIGDVHGCFHTLEKLLECWDNTTEQLIFIGDLIDRGNFSPQTVQLVKQLVKNEDAVCLMGNHEYAMVKAMINTGSKTWFGEMGTETLSQYKKIGFRAKNDAKWFEELPLIWQNEHFILSHAGVSILSKNPFDKMDRESVLWTRSELKKIEGKIQIHGHTPTYENPCFNEKSNSWNIDSACVYSHKLTGMKFHIDGELLETIQVKTDKRDVSRKFELSE
jgi:serine/threonine protein phosphatase 1